MTAVGTGQRETTKAEAIEQVVDHLRTKLGDEATGPVETFARHYYDGVPADDIAERGVLDLYGSVLALWHFVARRRPGGTKVRVYSPRLEDHGWRSTHTMVEIVTDDMPFLVDSVTAELNRRGLAIHLIVHPVFRATRDGDGSLLDVQPQDTQSGETDGVGAAESVLHFEIDRQTSPAVLDEIRAGVERVLADLRGAVEDWGPMRARMAQLADDLEARAASLPVDPDELTEAVAFLRWLPERNFTYVGFREYDLRPDGDDLVSASVPGTGLGVLRHRGVAPETPTGTRLSPDAAELALAPNVLVLTKTNSRSTVHRPAYMDYVGVRRFDDDGRVIGEWRFIGLYTSVVYHETPRGIPVLRRRVRRILEMADFVPASHNEKALLDVLETYPRDELLQTPSDELFPIVMGILHLRDRQRVRLFVRPDPYGRFLSCLVYVPRDRYDTDVRHRMEAVLTHAFHGTVADFSVMMSESMLARVHLVIRTDAPHPVEGDVAEVERRLVAATRSWTDDLKVALLEQLDEEAGNRLFRLYAGAFPAAYREDVPARNAVLDIQRMCDLRPETSPGMSLYTPLEAPAGTLRFKLFWPERAPLLSDVLPVLEAMGLKVVDERPYEVRPQPDGALDTALDPTPDASPDPGGGTGEGRPCWIHDFRLVAEGGGVLPAEEVREAFQEAFARVWHYDAESDGFNRLVLRAGLAWREVAVLRAYAKYLRQAGVTFSQNYMERTMAANPAVAASLVALFRARFDPDLDEAGRADAEVRRPRIEAALDAVDNLDQDRILRNFLTVILATVRTNWFQHDPDGRPKPWISFKLESSRVPLLPQPRPLAEIFVYSPQVEAVHLRGSRVARGGIRWSDRQEDFRTEVLGLMKAQMVKNAVIVPGGAKGGFVVKRPPSTGGDAGADRAGGREALMREVTACYSTFMRGMLDLTDNYAPRRRAADDGGDGQNAGPDGDRDAAPDALPAIVPPARVVRHDGDDPYLVVAADKGTATFSDLANQIAAEYGFWLGDAFASGGSAGYDHKRMGITARGAWESVKRHFREMGVDCQAEDFTAVGVGDMSGDVFGNGMLLSEHTKLVAAFNHQHVFVDPDPDPAVSFAERRRLFELPRSGWGDYDRAKLSAGGGVWERTAKSIRLSPEARRALGIDPAATGGDPAGEDPATDEAGDGPELLTPNEVIRAILRAPVDLLFNGGIGTYVKAAGESHADAGDRTNDGVRVNGADLRCRVVAEGGNLGLTQLGRIEYALAGGRTNTDFIDNSAGVDTSDHEVNIKILLDESVDAGDLTPKQRNELLAEMTHEVADLVLHDNYRQAESLSVSESCAPEALERHVRLMRALEKAGKLNRALEFLPDHRALADRRSRGLGLTRPELAVLFAYAKITLQQTLLETDVLEEPAFAGEVVRYLPGPLRERYADQAAHHRLHREIVATHVTNGLVNRCGATFVTDVMDETGATVADIARAYMVVRGVFDLQSLWAEIEDLDGTVEAHVQTAMLLDGRRLAERAAVWLLRNRPQPLDVVAETERFARGAAAVARSLPDLLVGGAREQYERRVNRLCEQHVPEVLGRRVAWLSPRLSALDIVEVAAGTGRDVDEVAAVYFQVGADLDLEWLRRRVVDLPAVSHWDELARGALRDDLYVQHRDLVARILRVADSGDSGDADASGAGGGEDAGRPAAAVDPAKLVAAWVDANSMVVSRYRATVDDLKAADNLDLAMASVGLREVRNLARAGGGT